MNKRENLAALVQELIDKLSGQIPQSEKAHGWSEQCRVAMLDFFRQMLNDVRTGVDLRSKPEYLTLVRGLDHWGVTGGAWLEQAARVSNLARKL
jgi:hypothetical protein